MAINTADAWQQAAAQLLAQNQANDTHTNFWNSVQLGAGKRALGIEGAGLNAGQAMAKALGLSTDQIQQMKNNVALGQKYGDMEGQGTGAAGFAGEIAGDPISWLPGPFKAAEKAPALAKILGMSAHGTTSGAAAGITQGTQDPNSTIGTNLANGAVGGTVGGLIGAGIGTGAQVLKGGYNLARGLALRASAAMGDGNSPAATQIQNNIYAKHLIRAGQTPQEVSAAINNPNNQALGATLGEATQNPAILQIEKQLSRSATPEAKIMRDGLLQRNEQTIPGAIQNQIDSLNQYGDKADSLYKGASQEAQTLQDNANSAVQGNNPNFPLMNAQPLNQAHQTLQQMSAQVDARLAQKGNVSNIESSTLSQAKNIFDNGQRRLNNGDNYYDVLKDVKTDLGGIYKDNPSTAVQGNAQRYVAGYSGQTEQALGALAPINNTPAKSAAMSGMVAQDMADDAGSARTPAQIYTKFWSTPDLQNDTLRRLTLPDGSPDLARQQQVSSFMEGLKNVTRGHAGSDTSFNFPSATNLENDTLGFNPELSNPMESLPDAAKLVGRLYTPQVYKALATGALSPDDEALQKAMMARLSTPLNNPVVQGSVGPAAAAVAGSMSSPPTDYSVPAASNNPYMSLIPQQQINTANPYQSLIPQGAQ